jgi:hypothetical protein
MMMNWKRCCWKRPWPNFKLLFRNSPGGTEKKHENSIRIAGVLTARPRRSVDCGGAESRRGNVLSSRSKNDQNVQFYCFMASCIFE